MVAIRDDGEGTFVAEVDGEVVGTVTFGPSADVDGIGAVRHLEVDPDHRRRGIGTALLVAAEDALLAAGFEEAVTWVDQDDEGAQRFLAWHTWSTDGEIRELDAGTRTESRFRRLLGF